MICERVNGYLFLFPELNGTMRRALGHTTAVSWLNR